MPFQVRLSLGAAGAALCARAAPAVDSASTPAATPMRRARTGAVDALSSVGHAVAPRVRPCKSERIGVIFALPVFGVAKVPRRLEPFIDSRRGVLGARTLWVTCMTVRMQ